MEKVGSIIVPDQAAPESQWGIVIAKGSTVKAPIKEGDTVYFPKYVGLNFTIKGKRYYMIEEEYLIAK